MVVLVFALIGAVLGFAFLGWSPGGALLGAAIGALIWRSGELGNRMQKLERSLAQIEVARRAQAIQKTMPVAAPKAEPAAQRDDEPALRRDEEPGVAAAAPPTAIPPRARSAAVEATEPPAAAEPAPAPVPPRRSATDAAARAREARRVASREPEASAFEQQVLGYLKRWFTTGNVPVKVGVVLSVFGVGFLIKEGIDRHWLVLPIEFRLALVALFGVALLAIGWRLRSKDSNYARSVQGGGIAVLYLTTYASFALYDVLSSPAAFAALVIVTAAAGTLAVLQDSRALAVLGVVGGFMAPVLTSTDSGNHVALFSYYAILNLAIVGIAWFKAWRELNVLGFAFTFGIGGLWGYDAYRPELFATTEPFLVLFVLMYMLIPVLFALRQAPELRGFVDGTLLFGTPFVGFGLQSQLVADTEYGLAISAVALAAAYVLLATYLYRRRAAELRVLVEAQLALSLAFVTVAVPLALDARWTSAAWALQGAAMVWLGFRQRRKLALAAGIVLQVLSAGTYWEQPPVVAELPLLNGYFLGAVLLALAAWFSGRLFEPHPERVEQEWPMRSAAAASAFLVWASGWWLYAGFAEINRVLAYEFELPASLVFVAATVLLAMLGARRFAWPRLNVLGLVAWPIALFGIGLAPLTRVAHPAADFGWLAWPVFCATLFVFLRYRERQFERLAGALHAVACWTVAALLVWEAHWQVGRVTDGIWPAAAAFAVAGALVLATLRARDRIAWPIGAHARAYVALCCGGVLAALLLATLLGNLVSPGDAPPLPYVPLLNPLEVVSVFVFIVLLRWLTALQREHAWDLAPRYRAALAGAFGLFLVTMAVARTVHHWAGVPFDAHSLAASTTLQAALSIVWGATALATMMVGARAAQRAVWLVGAALMTVVVAKLFVVDLGAAGTLGRIVSFLGVGVLLLIVGYFAPVPPRTKLDTRAA